MKTRKIQIRPTSPVVPSKEEVQSPVAKIIADSPIPEQLGSTLEAWKLLGNKWLSCMEANIELHTLGKKIAGSEKGEIELNGIRALVFMGYMVERKGGFAEGWLVTYRLSEQGKKIVGMKETTSPGARNAKPKTDALVECPDCKGAGVLDNGDLCVECMGTGETNPYSAAAKFIAPNAKLSTTIDNAKTIVKSVASVVKPKIEAHVVPRHRVSSRKQ